VHETVLRDSSVLVMGGLSVFTCSLCIWQLYRYDWKLNLLKDRKKSISSPSVDISMGPVPCDLRVEDDPNGLIVVQLAGARLEVEAPVATLSPRTAPENLPPYIARLAGALSAGQQISNPSGRQLVAPLLRADGSRILAILGWIPASIPSPKPLVLPQQHDTVLRGVLRFTDTRKVLGVPGAATNANEKEGNFSFIDTHALAAHFGLSSKTGDVIDSVVELVEPYPSVSPSVSRESTASPWPITRQWEQLATASLAPPHTHLVYAATWAALTAFGAAATYFKARGGARGLRRSSTYRAKE